MKVGSQFVVEDAGADLEEEVSSAWGPAHLLFLHHAFADDLVHGGLGCADLGVLAELAKGRMRSKIPDLTEALTGRFTTHHGFLIRMHLRLFDQYSQTLSELDARIEEAMEPFRPPGNC